jgi:Spx/MgsR family transcriptional regulator
MLRGPVPEHFHFGARFHVGDGVITVYGLKTCDTCRKALAWLKDEKIAHRFVDVRADGIAKADVSRFARAVGWEKLLNKASTTWRELDEGVKSNLTEGLAVALMVEHPTLIKRPVFEMPGNRIVSGFREAEKAAVKAASK